MWQAMLMSAGLPNSKKIFIHGFITANGQKMSKSLGNVINPIELVKKYGTDAARYYLLREIPPTEDGDFTYEKFEQRYNADLAGGIGNLVARVLGISTKISNFKFEILNKIENKELKKEIKNTQKEVAEKLEDFRFNEALAVIWELISFCDKYINDEKLWETQNPKVINDLFFAIKEIAELLGPFLPATSEKIKGMLEGRKIENLFPRLPKN
jgi:methionyl-tRNA synthetase